MATVLVNANVTLESQQLLEGLTQLDTSELEKIYESIGLILEQRKGSTSPSTTVPAVENSAIGSNIPIAENLIPTSITLDSNRISF